MKIGLYNLEHNIHNPAMMQVSQYYKQQGAEVEEYITLLHDTYDKIYAFSLFDFTDKSYTTNDMICGGTGFDITSRLPKEIEDCDLDYSISPSCDFSMIWFSRGCFRKCPFCVVNKKEGYIRPVEPKNLNPNGKYIKVMDNNFFANPNIDKAMDYLLDWKQPVDIQGFDIRIFNDEQGEMLSQLKFKKYFKFAWDNPRYPKEKLDEKIDILLKYVKSYKLMCYILIGYWSTPQEDYDRVMHLINKYNIYSYVMPYNKNDCYQKDFVRWVNDKKIFYKYTWEEYQQEIGRSYI